LWANFRKFSTREKEMATSELATRETPGVLQTIQRAKPQIEGRLPIGFAPDKFTLGLMTVVQKNPDLLKCEPNSVLLAAYEAAELGINLSPTLQLGYLIPYGGKAQFQISWRGFVQRAYETGCVSAFYAEVVYENDKFERQFAPKRNLFHAPADGDRGESIGAYALVEFKDGHIDWEYCDRALIDKHRKHSKMPDSMMWKTFTDEAWRKTAIRLLAKRLPLTNPNMEKLAEIVEHDAAKERTEEPSGRLELEAGSPLQAPKPAAAEVSEAKTNGNGHAKPDVYIQFDKQLTLISGNTYALKDNLPKVGATWDKAARVWSMPAARTHELVALCESKHVNLIEVDENGKPIPDAAEREPGEELPFES
jgi:recombination protein RecT